MPLAQLADPWQKMPVGGTAGEVSSSVCPHVAAQGLDQNQNLQLPGSRCRTSSRNTKSIFKTLNPFRMNNFYTIKTLFMALKEAGVYLELNLSFMSRTSCSMSKPEQCDSKMSRSDKNPRIKLLQTLHFSLIL